MRAFAIQTVSKRVDLTRRRFVVRSTLIGSECVVAIRVTGEGDMKVQVSRQDGATWVVRSARGRFIHANDAKQNAKTIGPLLEAMGNDQRYYAFNPVALRVLPAKNGEIDVYCEVPPFTSSSFVAWHISAQGRIVATHIGR